MRVQCCAVLLALSFAAHGQNARLVRDIAPPTYAEGSNPFVFASTDRAAFFATWDGLWITDGTTAGTRLVFETPPLLVRVNFFTSAPLVASGDIVYFFAEDRARGLHLWRTDGSTAGTFPVTLGHPLQTTGLVASLGSRRAVFSTEEGTFFTDGSTATKIDHRRFFGLTSHGDRVYMRSNRSLFVTDGRSVTHLIEFLGQVYDITPVGSRAIVTISRFPDPGYDIWRTDGTRAGTYRLGGFIERGTGLPAVAGIGSTAYILVPFRSRKARTEIWASNAAETEFVRVTDVDGPLTGDVSSTGSRLLFGTKTPVGGTGLLFTDVTFWSTDGMRDGTRKLGAYWSNEFLAVATSTRFFVQSRDGLYTSEGTTRLELLAESHGFEDYDLENIGVFGESILTAISTESEGEEPWISDGTPSGTRLLKNIRAEGNSGGSNPRAFGRGLLFSADDGIHGLEPWVSDGTPDGTRMIGDIFPGLYDSDPVAFTDLGNGHAIFLADSPVFGTELWSTDGVTAQVVVRNELDSPSLMPFLLEHFPVLNRKAFLFSDQLWTTDGTASGTQPAAPVTHDYQSDSVVWNGAVWFAADGSLWRSDGTANGTVAIAPVAAERIVAAESRLFLLDENELWVSDGTTAGTREIAVLPDFESRWLVAAGDRLFFAWTDPEHGTELWVSDGTEAHRVTDIAPGFLSSIDEESRGAVYHRGFVYFAAGDAVHGFELWRSDGTSEGTTMVTDIAPGALSSNPEQLTAAFGRVYFTAFEPEHGRELWFVGSGAATLLADIDTGPDSSLPHDITAAGASLFVFATTSETGDELWTVEPDARKHRAVR